MSEKTAFIELNETFDNAMVALKEHYIREIQDLRNLYAESERRNKELEREVKILKGK